MKKLLKIGMPLLIVALMLGTIGARADYNVTAGSIFTYDVVESSWTLTDGTNSGTGDGFIFEDTGFAVGTQVEVEVLTASTTQVDYNETIGSVYDESSATPLDMLGVALVLFFPLFMGLGSITWNQTEIEMGPGLMGLYFVEPTIASDFFYELTNETLISEDFSMEDTTFTQIGGNFDNSSTIAVFDWVMEASLVNASLNTDFSGLYRWKIAFNKDTGQVKGTKLSMNYDGTVEGTARTIIMEQLIEEVSFDIGNFFYGGGFIPGFEWFVALPAIALLSAIAVIIRKRK